MEIWGTVPPWMGAVPPREGVPSLQKQRGSLMCVRVCRGEGGGVARFRPLTALAPQLSFQGIPLPQPLKI